ncbi:hypothetical protein [Enterocloster bolteae]|uniref:hypothetical protein n=1 Tax=Enterocloster bolteae TaxID=208479 RepID=UPI00242BB671|nr:hypothetical protein [Enterocloster bolteae]
MLTWFMCFFKFRTLADPQSNKIKIRIRSCLHPADFPAVLSDSFNLEIFRLRLPEPLSLFRFLVDAFRPSVKWFIVRFRFLLPFQVYPDLIRPYQQKNDESCN